MTITELEKNIQILHQCGVKADPYMVFGENMLKIDCDGEDLLITSHHELRIFLAGYRHGVSETTKLST